ncbi:beta-ketoacyl synthase N-terminal-like domain-containing protein [Pseudoalteromonas piscicida]|uniref:beta-ketoacyl synthase N-terminal-like domain-containing protein n=1 Tax=Pseudoalteromonas piscicida TaxID=43662 RepID=UPI0030B5D01D
MEDREINDNDIAIIGMAGKFPQADNIGAFWEAILEGKSSASRFTEDELREKGVSESLIENPDYVPVANVLDGIESFDAEFFGFTEQEGTILDPQRRILFETVYHAIEDAGYIGSGQRIGLYLGNSESEYFFYHVTGYPELFQSLGGLKLSTFNDRDFTATQIAYKLDLRGPAVNINTACSTSLVAVHHAVNAILNYECDMAVAGGASVALSQQHGYLYKEGGINSALGECRPFDVKADGTLAGSGGAAVLLKRLSDAIKDGDNIYAVIRGTATNNDGARKVGYTAPSLEGQLEVLNEAMYVADLEADQISYVETHGTGTALGDPIEFAALTRAFNSQSQQEACALGSLKANFGHMNAAAGVAGLIKVAKMLQTQYLPPQINFSTENENLDLSASPFFINTTGRRLNGSTNELCAGVSAFGIGGTNAHVVLQQPPTVAHDSQINTHKPVMFLVSAKSDDAVQHYCADLQLHCQSEEVLLHDASYTLIAGRQAFSYRRAVLANNREELLKGLSNHSPSQAVLSQAMQMAPLTWLFSGQGEDTQYCYCALYQNEIVFRDAAIEAWKLFCEFDESLYSVMLTDSPEHIWFRITQDTVWQQPVLFVYGYALSQLWRSWGIAPDCVLGHSLGEFLAAYNAGLWSLKDAVKLVYHRARLMAETVPGGMLSISLSEAMVERVLAQFDLDIAAVNASESTVLSGEIGQIEQCELWCLGQDIATKRLPVTQAFHSRHMTDAAQEFSRIFETVLCNTLTVPFFSTCRAQWLSNEQLSDPQYWAEQICAPVRFRESILSMSKEQALRFMEIGPSQSLTRLMRRQLPETSFVYQARNEYGTSKVATPYFILADYWCQGGEFEHTAWFNDIRPRKVSLPGYPFQRKRLWLEKRPLNISQAVHRDDGKKNNEGPASWLYQPIFQPLKRQSLSRTPVVMFCDETPKTRQIEACLDRLKVPVFTVKADALAKKIKHVSSTEVCINPADDTHYQQLLNALMFNEYDAIHVVYTWCNNQEQDKALASFDDYYTLRRICKYMFEGNRNFVLSVLTSSVGEETSAMLTGLLKVASQEIDGLRCRYLSGEQTSEDSQITESLLALASEQNRYLQARIYQSELQALTYEPINLKTMSNNTNKLMTKPGGHYLMVGGLSSVGKLIGSYLADVQDIKLSILGTRALYRGDGINPVATPSLDNQQLTDYLTNELQESSVELMSGQAELISLVEHLTAKLIVDYLEQCLGSFTVGAAYALKDVYDKATNQAEYHKLVNYMLHFLQQQAVVKVSNGYVLPQKNHILSLQQSALEHAIESRFPSFNGLVQRLIESVKAYPTVLSGQKLGVEVLYPGGSAEFLNQTALDTKSHSNFRQCVSVVARMIEQLSQRAPNKPVRILEVGGGNGSLVKLLVKQLQLSNVHYMFTDIGASFVVRAKQLAAKHHLNNFSTKLLDINADLAEQGFEYEQFDLVLGYNVIHISPNVSSVTERLSHLLKPGGQLAYIEDVKVTPWTEMVWGLTKEWWMFDGSDGREISPLMDLDQWQRCLLGQSFSEVVTLPSEAKQRSISDVGLIIASKPNDQCTLKQQADNQYIDTLQAQGVIVDYVQCDMRDAEQIRALEQKWAREEVAIDGVFYAATTGTKSFAMIDESEVFHGMDELEVKAQGLFHLEKALRSQTPEFVYVMSSNSSILGGLGHGAYAAANAWQDAFCERMNLSHATQWLAVNWDSWGAAKQESGSSVVNFSMSETEALQALDLASQQVLSRVIVSRGDLNERITTWLDGPIANESLSEVVGDVKAKEQLTEIWAQTLGLNSVCDTDNFFQLGGDSLLAVQLISRINKLSLGKIKVADFIANPTLSGLIEYLGIAQNAPWSPLEVINESAPTPTVFCIHPGGGGVEPYRFLSEQLNHKVNFVGIKSRRFQEVEAEFHASIPDMATEYIKFIQSYQAQGPYYLMGYCFGCMVAHEVAKQLEAQGQQVAHMLLIDGYPPGTDDGYFDERAFIQSMFKRFNLDSRDIDIAKLAASPIEQRINEVIELIKPNIEDLSDPISVTNFIRELFYTNKIKNEFEQKGKVYSGATLIRTDDPQFHLVNNKNQDLGWQVFYQPELTIEYIPGNHYQVFEVEMIPKLIEKIKESEGFGFSIDDHNPIKQGLNVV